MDTHFSSDTLYILANFSWSSAYIVKHQSIVSRRVRVSRVARAGILGSKNPKPSRCWTHLGDVGATRVKHIENLCA
jgi:hypothetical protein